MEIHKTLLVHKSREKFQKGIFVLIWTLLLLLIPLKSMFPPMKWFFEPFLGWTAYGWLVLSLTVEAFIWSALKLVSQFPEKRGLKPFMESFKDIIKAFVAFIGFKKSGLLTETAMGTVVGIMLAISTVLSRAYFESLSIFVTNPLIVLYLLLTKFEMWFILLIAPIAEEIIYRGLLINRLVNIFANDRFFASAIAIISSSLIFGWTHLELPEYKALGSIILGVVYMWRWRNNILTTIAAHISANLLFIFLIVQ